MINLSVNLNKVALLRNSRSFGIPSVIKAASTCIQAGAHGITVHPRPDQRHIKPEDVYELAKMLTVEFNIEGNPSPEIFHYALSRLNLSSAEVLYIGDSLHHDYAGAMQAKIDFCYYNRKNQLLSQELQPKFIINNLLKLLKLLN